jgi:hypothetical protein
MSALGADLPATRLYWFTGDPDCGRIAQLMVSAAHALTRDHQQSV